MINETILFLPQTDCNHQKLKPYADELIASVFFNQDLHFGEPLKKIFRHVLRFEVGEPYANEGVIRMNNNIIELVKEKSPKYVIWPTRTYEILEETFQEIRKLGSYIILWFLDDETRFDNYSKWWTPYTDYVFTADIGSLSFHKKLNAKAYHMPVSAEPELFNPAQSTNSYDISFVGSIYVADRTDLVKKFKNDGVSIATFGKGTKNGFIEHDDMVNLFFSSKINICFTKSSANTRNQLKGKIFDITMSGGFLLCEYVEGIENFFELGKEIICFKNYNEALEKINYYLKHDTEREQIAKAGKIRARNELAQHKLLEKVFTEIELDIEKQEKRIIKTVSFLQMPKHIRIAHAQFHLRWANVLKKVGFEKKRWQEEYKTARKYLTFSMWINLRYKKITKHITFFKQNVIITFSTRIIKKLIPNQTQNSKTKKKKK